MAATPSTTPSAFSSAHALMTASEMAALFDRAGAKAGGAPLPCGGPAPGAALLGGPAAAGPATGRRVRPPVAAGPPGKGGPRLPARPGDDAGDALSRELAGRRGC